MKKKILAMILLFMTACLPTQNVQSDISPVFIVPSPTPLTFDKEDLPEPEDGKAIITGRLWSATSGEPLSKVVVRLAEVYYQNNEPKSMIGIYVLDNAFSPSAITDVNGLFVFTNVEPRDYVLFIGDVAIKHVVVTREDGKPQVWTVRAGEIVNLGDLRVEY
ncbi:MAG: hypothetical protein QXZ09_03585 [Candidatus Methanomethylicaceae archaeon]